MSSNRFDEEQAPKCNYCDSVFTTHERLKNHIKSTHQKIKCDRCPYESFYRDHFDKHNEVIHKSVLSFTCKDCEYVFGDEESLQKHRASVHENAPRNKDNASSKNIKVQVNGKAPNHTCHECGFVFSTDENLTIHMRNIHNNAKVANNLENKISYPEPNLKGKDKKLFKCELCPYEASKTHVNIHVRGVHQKIKDHLCKDCGSAFSRKENLKHHVRSVHQKPKLREKVLIVKNKNLFKCELCPYKASKQHVNTHVKEVHAKIKDHQCKECGSAFSRKENLEHHNKAVHQKIKNHKCDICESSFSKRADLKTHVKSVHLKERDYICNECKSSFSQKAHLQKHVKSIHSKQKDTELKIEKIKLIKCDLCSYEASEKDMNTHVRALHEKIKDQICKECGFAFSRKDSLKRHVKIVHLKERDHICNECKSSFSQKAHLQNHVKSIHLRQKDSLCNDCGKTYVNKSRLKKHVRAKHLQFLNEVII